MGLGRRALPDLETALGAAPTWIFSEIRTTDLSADEVVAAYTEALRRRGVHEFDVAAVVAGRRHRRKVRTATVGDRTMVVIEALGPKAFDEKDPATARPEMPPNTTVVWLIAVDG